MAGLLLGILLIIWAVSLLGWVAVSATFLGVCALIVGIVWVIESLGVAVPSVPVVRRAPPA